MFDFQTPLAFTRSIDGLVGPREEAVLRPAKAGAPKVDLLNHSLHRTCLERLNSMRGASHDRDRLSKLSLRSGWLRI